MTNIDSTFGIPIKKGRIISNGEYGFIVLFNFEHLLIKRLLGCQLYTKDREPISLVINPQSLPKLFNYPLLSDCPDFAIAQRESFVYTFIKSSFFNTTEIRLIYWFQRYSMGMENDYDLIDIPDQYVPLAIAQSKKNLYLHLGETVPDELEEEIKNGLKKMQEDGNRQNYFTTDTFFLSQTNLDKFSEEQAEKKVEWEQSKQDFCNFIINQFEKHEDKYRNLKNAVYIIFNRHTFNEDWTEIQCYHFCLKIRQQKNLYNKK